MLIRAKFVGTHLSLGYKHGETYVLRVKANRISPHPSTSAKPNTYGSVAAFLRNWDEISVVAESAIQT